MSAYLTLREAAAEIRQAESTLRAKLRRGEIKFKRLGRGPRAPIRIKRAELEKLLGDDSQTRRNGERAKAAFERLAARLGIHA